MESENWLLPGFPLLSPSCLDLCAHGMGLGVCWAGYFNFALRADHPRLKEATGIPVDCENYYPVMVGHPDERVKYYRMPPRKEPEIRFM